MAAFYLWINAGLYLAFAIWCILGYSRAARGLGYVLQESAGRSEFIVVYGGLQLGLAVLFAMLAANESLRPFGILAALAIYVPIVLLRIITILLFSPVGPVTIAVAVLEGLLLAAATFIWLSARS